MRNHTAAAPSLPCLCASVRRAARALTQLYEQELRPAGLRATQFTVLQALALAKEMSQGRVGQMLAMDSTTLTRTLRILRRHGWVEARPGGDRRERYLRLAPAGQRQLQRALPHWRKAQARMRRALGRGRWRDLLRTSNQLTSAATRLVKD